MTIKKYIPQQQYGFVSDAFGMEVFFHLSVFDDAGHEVLPLVGEEVIVEADLISQPMREQAQRAILVKRNQTPVYLAGEIQSYDKRGYGYVLGDDAETYHLHKSELLDTREELSVGLRVSFYAGFRQGKPRACYVDIIQR